MAYKDDKRVIDSNDAIINKITEINKLMSKKESVDEGFQLGIASENVQELLLEQEQEMQIKTDDMFKAAETQAQEILARAEGDAAHILEEAKKKAKILESEAEKNGYEKGINEAKVQIEQEIQKNQQELEIQKKNLEHEYEKKAKEMEPELVDIILDVVSKSINVLSLDKKDIIISLVDSVISNVEISSSYLIRACREDAEFLRSNKENIIKRVDKEITIEIVDDISMRRNECIIETDAGIYDCSLDIQLENLIRDIKILSCTMEK